MYNIIGADGKTYGPISLEQVKQWVSDGRIGAQTKVQAEGAAEWKAASQIPELAGSFPQPPPPASVPPPIGSITPPGPQQKGLAVTSLVLGIPSVFCSGPLTGIPAIICGHIAHSRAKRQPAQYGGAGLALAGLILGYVGTFLTLVILPAMLLPALSQAKNRAQRIHCVNNMKQIGLAFKTWQVDHFDRFPFNLSTTNGGTMELSSVGADGFDADSAFHFMVMSNELSTPRILVCPADTGKQPALDFHNLAEANISYRLHSGANITDASPQAVLAVCPIHGNELLCDGSVQMRGRRK